MCQIYLLRVGIGLLLVLLSDVSVAAQKPDERPPWQRVLTKEDVKRVAELEKHIATLSGESKFKEAQERAEKVLQIRTQAQGQDHWEAISARYQVEALQRVSTLPAEQQSAYAGLGKLVDQASTLKERGKYAQALPLDEKTLAIRQKVLGEEHPDTASSYNSVAFNLDALGKHAQAQPLFEKALAIRRKVLGEDHPDTARSHNNLGHSLSAQGKHAQAQPLVEQALAICRKVVGEEHPYTAASYNSVAFNLNAQGKYAQAQPLFQSALAIRQRMLGEKHVSTATSYNNVAFNLNAQGKYALAQRLFEKALAICQEVLGEEHPQTAGSYDNLARNLYAQGKYAEAQPLFEKALIIYQKVFGDEHTETATSYNNVAMSLSLQGKHARTQPLFEKVLAIYQKVLGEDHFKTAAGYSNMARNLNAQGKYAQAQPLFEKALAIYQKTLGEDHPDTARSYNSVARNLNAQGKYAQAQLLFEKALAIYQKVLGKEHPDTTYGYDGVAFNLEIQGKHAQAHLLYEKVLAIRQRVLGERHPETASSYNNMARNLYAQRKYAEAQPRFEKALAIYQKLLGEEHPDTARGHNNVAFNLNAQGKLQDAMRHWQAALLGYECGRMNANASGFDRALFQAEAVSPRAALAVALASLEQPLLAWQHAESDLGRGLLDGLKLDIGTTAVHQQTRLARLQWLDSQLVPLLSRSDLPEADKQRREELSRERSELLAALSLEAAERSRKRILSLEQIQQQIPPDAALVFWLDVHAEHWACILRREGKPNWQSLAGTGKDNAWNAADLELPDKTYAILLDPAANAAERTKLFADLRTQRLDPLEPYLKDVRHLLVVPIGRLAKVPVETLTDRYRVSYVPSATVFARLVAQHRPMQGDSLLALGDPVFTFPPIRVPEPPKAGLLLTAVLPGSAAARAGMKPGDVLLTYDSVKLTKQGDLQTAAEGAPPVLVTFWREGKEQSPLRLAAGRLGVVIDKLPATEAVKQWQSRQLSVVKRDDNYQPLPGTRLEVQSLTRLIPSNTTLLGSDASEQRLDELTRSGALKHFRLVHLATHGKIDEGRPTESALILAQDRLPMRLEDQLARSLSDKKTLDGRLTVGMILEKWDLDADLVVLSACETGLGKKAGGEGLLGFAQALLQKGARSVVLSRWKVDDSATALLMLRFYENALGKRADLKAPLPRAEALAEAKSWLRTLPRMEAEMLVAHLAGGELRGSVSKALPVTGAKPAALPEGDRPYAAPYYWAAFVLIGDPQ